MLSFTAPKYKAIVTIYHSVAKDSNDMTENAVLCKIAI